MSGQGLYHPSNEHDACGVGFVAHIKGVKSHSIIEQGLLILKNLDHRGAVGADKLMGDGAGILIQIPDRFFREEMAAQGVVLPPPGEYGVGMIFLPKEHASRLACEKEIERAVRAEKQIVLGWRDVPVSTEMPMSPRVREKEPVIRQIFIGRGPDTMVTDALERKLFVIRKSAGHAIQALDLKHCKEFFVPSMSARTIVYKGLLLVDQVQEYYRDLQDERCVSALAMVHQRFSTNTFPEWPLAHPYRLVAHNGEINTVKGNFNWFRAREEMMDSVVLGGDLRKLYPLMYEGQSDTACFDNALELLVMSGYPLAHAMMMMIPEAWENSSLMPDNRRAFYEYHAAMMEPWDGPAAMAFTDGRQIGGMLDRNGLRPARYVITEDDLVVMASETGVLPIPETKIVRKWRLEPGKMFLIDMEAGRIIDDREIKDIYANARPYRAWTNSVCIKLQDLKSQVHDRAVPEVPLLQRQEAFGYTQEDLKIILPPMALTAEEAIGSMGNDAPLAVLSSRSKPLYNYFRQSFAQVTNPPVDPIRESIIMSLLSYIGPKPNPLDTNNVNPQMRLEVPQPVLGFDEMASIRNIDAYTNGKFRAYELNICYPVAWGKEGIEAHLASLCAEAVDAVRSGHNILIVSDRKIGPDSLAIPALLATSAVHQHLVAKGLRASTGLVVETGSAKETHHFALLAGYGAEAVHPYLVLETLTALAPRLSADLTPEKAQLNFIEAVGKGLLKIMSKMGISTIRSYRGAKIFESIGLSEELLRRYFGTEVSTIGGIGLRDIARDAARLHREAYSLEAGGESGLLPDNGLFSYRKDGIKHAWNPDTIANLQIATRLGSYPKFKEWARMVDEKESPIFIRDFLGFKKSPISIDEVEPVESIVRHFVTGAMSFGALSIEAHEALALAMNKLGTRSNTGEGGEDNARYHSEVDGVSLSSKTKQIASGRFGVTAEYLVNAEEIQIKVAQGAKPGEGGQLPGFKVNEIIAKTRNAIPGISLISPPPHHDIYSIEDLAQLIFDLKNINPEAAVSVKLVAESGVGTIAAGVAKAKADLIVISGAEGGTGASPASSMRFAGISPEIGLAETQQTLVKNGLRGQVRLQTDGQLKTAKDVIIMAMLGADEFSFGTLPLIVLGCVMMRKCNTNTCPVGVATQDERLRRRFMGRAEYVVNFFTFLAQHVREYLSEIGVHKLKDIIGHTELIEATVPVGSPTGNVVADKWRTIDFSRLLYKPITDKPLYWDRSEFTKVCGVKDEEIIKAVHKSIYEQEETTLDFAIKNTDRAVGTMLSGVIARKYGEAGLPDGTINIKFKGSAGQSFGAFAVKGLSMRLEGEANDYFGKDLSGGRISILPPHATVLGGFAAEENTIAGNTGLYGATSGELYVNGRVGERFAVRNSGAIAVIEGAGDHCCEYMTGGRVVVLGKTGRNFAAGMSGSVAYVYDPDHTFDYFCNMDMVEINLVEDNVSRKELLELIRQHYLHTGSALAGRMLDDWQRYAEDFIQVVPIEYKRVLQEEQNKKLQEKIANIQRDY